MIISLHNDNLPIVKNLDQTISPILKDSFNRIARKLRISITNKFNMSIFIVCQMVTLN
jgi:hypothetical protein